MIKTAVLLSSLVIGSLSFAQSENVRVIAPNQFVPTYLPANQEKTSMDPFTEMNGTDKLKLAFAAKAAGVPSLVFDRAIANYESLGKSGQTARDCFVAADVTSQKAQSWMICSKPTIKVTAMPFEVGSGDRAGCNHHLFENSGCPRFFGNRPGYCLPSGGRYVTQQVYGARPNQDSFTELKGLDADQNDNAGRSVGLQPMPKDGKVTWNSKSQSAFAMPFQKDDYALNDLNSKAKGGLAVYVYPSREDVKKFRATGSAPYWNEQCATKIGKPGWLGSKDTDAPKPSQMKAEHLRLLKEQQQSQASEKANSQ